VSELAGIEPTPPASKGAGYVRLDHSATVGINYNIIDLDYDISIPIIGKIICDIIDMISTKIS
jgi:hypothetical protein